MSILGQLLVCAVSTILGKVDQRHKEVNEDLRQLEKFPGPDRDFIWARVDDEEIELADFYRILRRKKDWQQRWPLLYKELLRRGAFPGPPGDIYQHHLDSPPLPRRPG